jgi:DNA-binding NtrC family response regulator
MAKAAALPATAQRAGQHLRGLPELRRAEEVDRAAEIGVIEDVEEIGARLFYRLYVFPIVMPPLRERREDIPVLVEYLVDHCARKVKKNIQGITKESLDLLRSYPWPGNIRELQNVIERSVIVCEAENFSVDKTWLARQPLATEPKSPPDLSEKLAAREKEMIEAALRESAGRVFGPSGATTKLGMPRSTLESKIRSLKISKNSFRTFTETLSRRSSLESVQ